MRLLLVGLVVAALAGTGWFFTGAIRDSREWHEVRFFAERDLGESTTLERGRIGDLLRKRFHRPELAKTAPWGGVRIVQPQGIERMLLLFSLGNEVPPTFSSTLVSVLHDNRRDLSLTPLRPGCDATVVHLRGSVPGAPGPWSFEMTVARRSEKEALERHVYTLIDESPVLIRLEDGRGALRPNDYRGDVFRVGESVPDRRPEEWERALESPDLAEVLRTLLWLGGEHDHPYSWEWPAVGEESLASAQAHRELLENLGVKSKLIELRMHPHPWVAEAAAQVEIAD
jgi:hypothetical protein